MSSQKLTLRGQDGIVSSRAVSLGSWAKLAFSLTRAPTHSLTQSPPGLRRKLADKIRPNYTQIGTTIFWRRRGSASLQHFPLPFVPTSYIHMLRQAMSGRLVRCAASLRTVTSVPRISGRPLRSSSLFFSPAAASRVSCARHVSTEAVPAADAPHTFEADDAEADASVTRDDKEEKQRLMRLVKRELQHVVDPYHIGKLVENLLAKDEVEHALLLTQTASKYKPVVVAWNHLITYFFMKDQFRRAITSYNQVNTKNPHLAENQPAPLREEEKANKLVTQNR